MATLVVIDNVTAGVDVERHGRPTASGATLESLDYRGIAVDVGRHPESDLSLATELETEARVVYGRDQNRAAAGGCTSEFGGEGAS